jgi:uncharacterized protein YegP (UPF0339 family)
MNEEINKAIEYSMKYHCRVFVYSNGNKIDWGDIVFIKEGYKHIATYENGIKLCCESN